jgi:glycosyltransferase involved in cell wall biosynthesis
MTVRDTLEVADSVEAAVAQTELVWMTNIPTPYRMALWRALASEVRLLVVCLAASESNREWRVALPNDVPLRILGVPAIRQQVEGALYAPSRSIRRVIREARPNAIVLDGWESPAFLQARWVASREQTPVVASYRSTLDSHRFNRGPVAWLRRWFFHHVDSVLTAGPASTHAVEAMGVPRDAIVTGFNSVDVEAFAAGTRLCRKVAKPRIGHTFLYVGQLIQRKNIDAAFVAFAQIRNEDDRFFVVGSGPEGPRLEQLAMSLGIGKAVEFCGHREGPGLLEAYGNGHTLVLPSTEEIWGLVVNEALAAGMHSVVSSRAGIAPSIEHMAGVFIAEPDSAGLGDAMAASRAEWAGPLADPEMLEHTPERAARAVLEATRVAKDRRAGRQR